MKFNTKDITYYCQPFDHWVLDNFLDINDAKKLSNQFIDFDNPTEEIIPPLTYSTFSNLLSNKFINKLSEITGISSLYPDIGLHGGGWHMSGKGGSLAMHLDYSIHPKMNLQRKLNLIIYLEEDYDPEWGGSLQFWSHDDKNKKPLTKVKEIEPIFNKAILFDTTQNSWHGFPEPINPPRGKMRKSIAVYYMTDITSSAQERYRARYVGV